MRRVIATYFSHHAFAYASFLWQNSTHNTKHDLNTAILLVKNSFFSKKESSCTDGFNPCFVLCV